MSCLQSWRLRGRGGLGLGGTSELVLALPIVRIDLLGERAQSIQCPRFTNLGQFVFYLVWKTGIEVVLEGTVTVALDLQGQPVEVHNIPRDAVTILHLKVVKLMFCVSDRVMWTEG